MKNRRAVGLLSPMRDKNWRQEPGGRRDDTCDHGLSRSWKVEVWATVIRGVCTIFFSGLLTAYNGFWGKNLFEGKLTQTPKERRIPWPRICKENLQFSLFFNSGCFMSRSPVVQRMIPAKKCCLYRSLRQRLKNIALAMLSRVKEEWACSSTWDVALCCARFVVCTAVPFALQFGLGLVII